MMIDVSNMTEISKLSSSLIEDKEDVVLLAKEAKQYINDFNWCKSIKRGWFAVGWGDILNVFLLEIESSNSTADNLIWVVNGDLPTVYIDIESAKTKIQVIQCYVDLMEDWISCIYRGGSIEDCYPIGVPPTFEYAQMLNTRIKIIKEEILD